MYRAQATVLSDLPSSGVGRPSGRSTPVAQFPETRSTSHAAVESSTVAGDQVELSRLSQRRPSCGKIENMRWLRMVAALVTVACLSSEVVAGICLVECDRGAPLNPTRVAASCHEAAPSGASSSVRRVAQCCHQPSELSASAGSPVTIALGKYLLADLPVSDPRELSRKSVTQDPGWHLTPPGPPDISSFSPLRL
jgi:hypothetical protein